MFNRSLAKILYAVSRFIGQRLDGVPTAYKSAVWSIGGQCGRAGLNGIGRRPLHDGPAGLPQLGKAHVARNGVRERLCAAEFLHEAVLEGVKREDRQASAGL